MKDINILFWNARGMGNEPTVSYLQEIINQHKVLVCVILEPMVPDSGIRRLFSFCGENNWLSNQDMGGKIWILWTRSVQSTLLLKSAQSMTVQMEMLGRTFCITAVYAKYVCQLRRALWGELRSLHLNMVDPWLWGGDFNTIRGVAECLGGAPPLPLAMEEFNSCIHDCAMMEVPTSGSRFTWCNKAHGLRRKWQVLDRVLQSPAVTLAGGVTAQCLHREHSDHAPILCTWASNCYMGPRLWRFLRTWCLGVGFDQVIVEAWAGEPAESALRSVHLKLKKCKLALKKWNRECFGNIFERKQAIECRVLSLEEDLCKQWDLETFDQLSHWKSQWKVVSRQEETYWKQKSRIKWLQEGDSNSKFFHAMVKSRVAIASVESIKDDSGALICGSEAIHVAAISYFKELFSSEQHSLEPELLGMIPSLVTADDNAFLLQDFDLCEARTATFSISTDSAAGIDGFSSAFFTHAWGTVGPSIVAAANEFLRLKFMPQYFAHSCIVMIPKVPRPSSFSDFRPISLCPTVYKINAKMINNRLASLLPKLISANQGAFIRGRAITDNIALTQEISREIGRKGKRQNVILSLDMHKAYDRVEWDFLAEILLRFGFHEDWIRMVMACVSSCQFSVVFQGVVRGFFKSSRGLRQGDPLSPSLFILAQDVLSRALNTKIMPADVFLTTKASCPSHLMFADDIILFPNVKRRSIMKFMRILDLYQRCSGQLLNARKCKFFLPSSAPRSRVHVVERATLFSRGSFPFTYLGVPVGPGKRHVEHFRPTIDKIMGKVQGWQAHLLSAGGRLVLIKHVLSSMPIHLLAVTDLPELVFKRIESILARFFWGTSEFGRKRHWANWRSLCLPAQEGGLGIRDLRDIRNAFILKQCWLIASSDSVWASFMRTKYSISTSPFFWSSPVRGSVEWRKIVKFKSIFGQLCAWKVGKGDVSFWYDKWNSEFTFDFLSEEESKTKLNSFCKEGRWNFEELVPLMGEELVTFVGQLAPVLTEEKDLIQWDVEPSGLFSMKSAWNALRRRGRIRRLLSCIWQTPIPLQSKIIVWRSFKQILPVDLIAKKQGFQLASKCNCCVQPQEESLQHLFNESELASALWSYFGIVMGKFPPMVQIKSRALHRTSSEGMVFAVPFVSHMSIQTRVAWWFYRCTGSSHFASLGRVTAVAICRQIWSFRNNMMYGGVQMDFMKARLMVIDVLQNIEGSIKPKRRNSLFGIDSLTMLGIRARDPLAKPLRRCSWVAPCEGKFALNVDGSMVENKLAVGGVFRDAVGGFKGAFAGPMGTGTSLQSEILALHEGLKLAQQWGFHGLDVWSDSGVLVSIIGKPSPYWMLKDKWNEIQEALGRYSRKLQHTFREGNHGADRLSKWGHTLQHLTIYHSYDELPLMVHEVLDRDARGLSRPRSLG